ncbi:MAG TPA: DUF4382 domain-containing protein [Candidatus Thermoplasmatota archaeon]
MKRTTIWVSSLTVFAVALAGCVGDFTGPATGQGSAVVCVQDDPTVNFNGVFVNFGNIQINQNTSGNNTVNDDDEPASPTTAMTDGTDGTATSPTDTGQTAPATTGTTTQTDTTQTTSTTTATDTTQTTDTVQTTETVAQGGPSSVETITVEDIDCGRVEAEGNFDEVFRGQAGGPYGTEGAGDDQAEPCASENPGCIADDRRGQSDSPCDEDQGVGNDAKCDTIEVETGDVDVMQFQDRKAAFLAQADLEPGTIQDVCMTVEDVRVVTNDGQEVNVDIQGGDLCLDGPIVIEEDKHTLVVFKVDVEESFVQSSGDQIVFSPVIRIQAAAPVTTTITVEETVTQTSMVTGNGTASPTNTTETTMTTDTAGTTSATMTSSPAPTTETMATTSTTNTTTSASPTPTTTGP